jgi:hypothetical protein
MKTSSKLLIAAAFAGALLARPLHAEDKADAGKSGTNAPAEKAGCKAKAGCKSKEGCKAKEGCKSKEGCKAKESCKGSTNAPAEKKAE